jgi:hypothetical protein
MASIRHNHGYSWDEYNFQNHTDSKGQGAPERVQGCGKPFETTQGDEKSYQRSYDNLRNYDFSKTFSIDPLDGPFSFASSRR